MADSSSDESSSSTSSSDTVLISKFDRTKLLKLKSKSKASVAPQPTTSRANRDVQICVACERAADPANESLLVCSGPCGATFHASCVDSSNKKDRKRDEATMWKCSDCRSNSHVCFHCKERGKVADSEKSESDYSYAEMKGMEVVRKCRARSCGKFYHRECISTLPLARISGTHFICPLHTCAACEQSGTSKDSVQSLWCVRCPVAYHTQCLPLNVEELPGHRILCLKHASNPAPVQSEVTTKEEESLTKHKRHGSDKKHAKKSKHKKRKAKKRSHATNIIAESTDDEKGGDNPLDVSMTSSVEDNPIDPATIRKRLEEALGQSDDEPEAPKQEAERAKDSDKESGSSDEDDSKWVQCDACKKWRTVAQHVNLDSLPDEWYCTMNHWDPDRASCTAPEQEVDESVESPRAFVENTSKEKNTKKVGKPTEPKKRKASKKENTELRWVQCDSSSCQKWRVVPPEVDMTTLPDVWTCKQNTWSPELAHCNVENPPEVIAELKKSQPKRPAKKAKSEEKPPAENPWVQAGKGVVLEWAQCEKCNKWRKLPAHVKSATLPDKWYCSLNHWDPKHADCSIPEEADNEAEAAKVPRQNYFYNANVAGMGRGKKGKLTYTELLFGHTGHLRKTYTAESSSLYFKHEGQTYWRDDMYRHSYMYQNNDQTLLQNQTMPQAKDAPLSKPKSIDGLDEQLIQRVAVLLMDKVEVKRERSMLELTDAVQKEETTDVVSLAVVASALSKLVAEGLVLRVEKDKVATYRKLPRGPLKATKAWKSGGTLATLLVQGKRLEE